jgi:hypothetical protein
VLCNVCVYAASQIGHEQIIIMFQSRSLVPPYKRWAPKPVRLPLFLLISSEALGESGALQVRTDISIFNFHFCRPRSVLFRRRYSIHPWSSRDPIKVVKMNTYWLSNLQISKKIITQDLQYYLGPDSHVRPYTRQVRPENVSVVWTRHSNKMIGRRWVFDHHSWRVPN